MDIKDLSIEQQRKLQKGRLYALKRNGKIPEETKELISIPINGKDGKDGKDGINGKDGRDGIDGKDGKDGINGIDGKDGRDGIDGKDGEQGPKGENGEPGKDGKDGLTPSVEFANGKDFDRLKINGKVQGPHLTGPSGKDGSAGQMIGIAGGQSDHGNLEGLSDDDHPQYFRLDQTSAQTVSNGSPIFGNGLYSSIIYSTGDLTIDAGTEKTLILNSYVWDDIRITPGNFDRPGISDPDIVAYVPGGAGSTTYLWEFAKGDIASFTVQMPHNYAIGQGIYAHLHWTPGANASTENGSMVGWKINYTWANINDVFAPMSTIDLQDACDGTNHKHQMTPEILITASSNNISSMLLCNVKRTDTGTDDTWAGTASGSLPMLLEIDFHYPIDTMGSRTVSAK